MPVYIHPQPPDGCTYGPYRDVQMEQQEVRCLTMNGNWLTMFRRKGDGWKPEHYQDRVYQSLDVEKADKVAI